MKTVHNSKCIVHRWGCKVALLLAVFNLHSSMFIELQAQIIEDGEAFYIYRNDGDFNGFFYDQVEEMRVSKIDLDSIEHDEYVVQEVVTADSIFRIPLAAIDSIGFVQPEIKFAPNVRQMDMMDITKYITRVEDEDLYFSKDIPAELVPKVGEIIIGATGPFAGKGFGGKVRHIVNNSEYYRVMTDRLTEQVPIFEQYVSVEEVTSDPATGQVRRRVAGYNQIKKAGGFSSGTLIDFSLNGHFTLIPDNLGVYFGVDVNSGIKVKLLCMHQIYDTHYFIKVMLAEDYNVSAGMSFAIKGSGEKSLGEVTGLRPSILFPAAAPLFSIHPVPDLAVTWSGEFKAAVTFPVKSGSLRQTFIIDTDSSTPITYQGNESVQDDPPASFVDGANIDLQFNGTLGVGIKSEIGIFTADWIKYIFDCGIATDVFVGPKLEGQVNLSMKDYLTGDGPYSLKDSHFTLSPLVADYNTYGRAKIILGDEPWKWTFLEGSFKLLPALDMYLFPSLQNMTAKYDDKKNTLTAGWETDMRMVFWPSEVGMSLYKMVGYDRQNLDFSYAEALSFGSYSPQQFTYTYNTKNLRAGKYYVSPLLKAFGNEYNLISMQKEFVVTPYIDCPTEKVSVSKSGGTVEVPFKCNANYVKATIIKSNDGTQLVTQVSDPQTDSNDRTLTISANENTDQLSQKEWKVQLLTSAEGQVAKDTITVTQNASGVNAVKRVQIAIKCPLYYNSHRWGKLRDRDPYDSSGEFENSSSTYTIDSPQCSIEGNILHIYSNKITSNKDTTNVIENTEEFESGTIKHNHKREEEHNHGSEVLDMYIDFSALDNIVLNQWSYSMNSTYSHDKSEGYVSYYPKSNGNEQQEHILRGSSQTNKSFTISEAITTYTHNTASNTYTFIVKDKETLNRILSGVYSYQYDGYESWYGVYSSGTIFEDDTEERHERSSGYSIRANDDSSISISVYF